MTNIFMCGTNSLIEALTEKDKCRYVFAEQLIAEAKKAKQAGASQCFLLSNYAYARKPRNCPKSILGYKCFEKSHKKSGRS